VGLERLGISNVRFDQCLMRGFDYYTGIVFEVYDLNPANRRSVFGGGRYDDLLALFGNDKVPAVGFGAGDLVARDIMETYKTLPAARAPADLGIAIAGEESAPFALDLAQSLRNQGARVSVDLSFKKVSDQIGKASKNGLPFVTVIGEEEVRGKAIVVKRLADSVEKTFSADAAKEIATYLCAS
jgi:histidyl-tRNA synthetase